MSPGYKTFVNKIFKHHKARGDKELRPKLNSEQYEPAPITESVPVNSSLGAPLPPKSQIHQEELQLEVNSTLSFLYEPGDDELYLKKALEVTRNSRRYMHQALTDRKHNEHSLRDALTPAAFVAGAIAGGREMIDGELRDFSLPAVKDYIAHEKVKILEKGDMQPNLKKNITVAAESLAMVATKLEGIICNLLPQSPEYTVPFGFLMIILKSVVAKRRKQEEAIKLLDSLAEKLPIITLIKVIYPNVKIKILVADIYINTLNLLQQIANYLSSNPIIKLLDATFALERYDFSTYLTSIEKAKGDVEQLFQICHIADTKTVKVTVDSTATVVKSIYDDLGGLSKIVSDLENAQKKRDTFWTHNIVSNLNDLWVDSIVDPEDELGLWKNVKFSCSAKDHWAVNGILPKISEWQRSYADSVLWISSPHMGRDSWLTQFSLDLIGAAQTEGHVLTFAMCDRPESRPITFICLLKQLISQLLHYRPRLILEVPSLFTPRSLAKAITLEKVMQIFQGLVENLEFLLVIIDRIDLCHQEGKNPEGLEMLRLLSNLAYENPGKLKVLITSAEDIPDFAFAGLSVSVVKVDLKKKKRQGKKSNFLDGAPASRKWNPLRPTYTRMSRRWISIRTLNVHGLDFFFDKDPEYVIIKRWVPEYEQDFLWNHTKVIRDPEIEVNRRGVKEEAADQGYWHMQKPVPSRRS